MPSTEFASPEDYDEAISRRESLARDVQDIQAQLANRNKTDKDGNRLPPKEYWEWRNAATHALNAKLDELRFLKRWIHENRPTNPGNRNDASRSAIEHLAAVYKICKTLRDEEVDFDPDETAKIDAAGMFLKRVGSAEQPK